jgi:hypothetical protein
MKPSKIIEEQAIKLAKEELLNEYGYMGKENAGHYVVAILEYLDEVWQKEQNTLKKLKEDLKE